jgi:hypothetical protein
MRRILTDKERLEAHRVSPRIDGMDGFFPVFSSSGPRRHLKPVQLAHQSFFTPFLPMDDKEIPGDFRRPLVSHNSSSMHPPFKVDKHKDMKVLRSGNNRVTRGLIVDGHVGLDDMRVVGKTGKGI